MLTHAHIYATACAGERGVTRVHIVSRLGGGPFVFERDIAT